METKEKEANLHVFFCWDTSVRDMAHGQHRDRTGRGHVLAGDRAAIPVLRDILILICHPRARIGKEHPESGSLLVYLRASYPAAGRRDLAFVAGGVGGKRKHVRGRWPQKLCTRPRPLRRFEFERERCSECASCDSPFARPRSDWELLGAAGSCWRAECGK